MLDARPMPHCEVLRAPGVAAYQNDPIVPSGRVMIRGWHWRDADTDVGRLVSSHRNCVPGEWSMNSGHKAGLCLTWGKTRCACPSRQRGAEKCAWSEE